jgi:hypothetical protein
MNAQEPTIRLIVTSIVAVVLWLLLPVTGWQSQASDKTKELHSQREDLEDARWLTADLDNEHCRKTAATYERMIALEKGATIPGEDWNYFVTDCKVADDMAAQRKSIARLEDRLDTLGHRTAMIYGGFAMFLAIALESLVEIIVLAMNPKSGTGGG